MPIRRCRRTRARSRRRPSRRGPPARRPATARRMRRERRGEAEAPVSSRSQFGLRSEWGRKMAARLPSRSALRRRPENALRNPRCSGSDLSAGPEFGRARLAQTWSARSFRVDLPIDQSRKCDSSSKPSVITGCPDCARRVRPGVPGCGPGYVRVGSERMYSWPQQLVVHANQMRRGEKEARSWSSMPVIPV